MIRIINKERNKMREVVFSQMSVCSIFPCDKNTKKIIRNNKMGFYSTQIKQMLQIYTDLRV
jgi:hypothetical protein